jgi:hypothetical protein
LCDLGKKDSAEQKMLRAMLKGELQAANLSKAPGIKDLVLTGFVGNVDERAARASMALGQLLKAPDSGFSPLEDIPEPPENDQVGQGEKMKEYAEAALTTLGLKMEVAKWAPPPPPPVSSSWASEM